LLKYDTVYGRYDKSVEHTNEELIVDRKKIQFTSEKDPAQLPWNDLDVDIVFECTGVFRHTKDLKKHIKAGAKAAILSATVKSGDTPHVVHGVNTPEGKKIVSCASCTTNCITPVVEILGRRIGIKKAIMTTVHAYTSSQAIIDAPNKNQIRRGRAGAENFVPTTTGAAKATAKVLPQYEGKFDGIAIRGPVPVGSIGDIVLLLEKDTTAEAINQIFKEEAESNRYQGIVGITEDPIVSSDIQGDSHSTVIDAGMTQVVDGNLVKVLAWYDNEWGYASQMVREALQLAEEI